MACTNFRMHSAELKSGHEDSPKKELHLQDQVLDMLLEFPRAILSIGRVS